MKRLTVYMCICLLSSIGYTKGMHRVQIIKMQEEKDRTDFVNWKFEKHNQKKEEARKRMKEKKQKEKNMSFTTGEKYCLGGCGVSFAVALIVLGLFGASCVV